MPKAKQRRGKKEDVLTVTLTQELRRLGLDVTDQAELKGKGGGWADALVKLGRQSIIIEAKVGQDNAAHKAALDDCVRRIENGHCTVAVAVCYPQDAAISTFMDAELDYAILDIDNSNPAWLSGTPKEVASAIKLAPAQLGNADLAASQLRGELDKVLGKLSIGQKRELARVLDLPTTPMPKKASGVSGEKYAKTIADWESDKYDTAAIRGCLVIASAMLLHARLDEYLGPEQRPEYDSREESQTRYDGSWPPKPLYQCKDATDIATALSDEWNTIMALDYKPVFQTAIAGMKAPLDDRNWRDCLKIIADAAGNLTADLAGGRQDVMGRIFHRVLDTAPYDGSYYTGTPGATLLATLSIRPEDRDWNDLDIIARMNITDPACGTGTLPIAAASRIRELATDVDRNKLSEILVEKVLHLYDINLTATHMASTTLGLMSPSTQFKNMNVHRTRLGPPQIKQGQPVLPAQLGSLEWLDGQPTLIRWPEYKASEHIETRLEKAQRLAHADLFIMNPPFARDSLRYDQFTEAEEEAIKQREESLLRNTGAHRSGGTHGFTVLAKRHLRQDGRIASIYPIAMAQAKSALKIRELLGKDMHVEYVVALKDPQGMAFSENTNIGEMLVIARQWGKTEQRQKATTTFVKILRKPKTPAQAKFLGESILRGDAHPDYATTHWPQARMEKGDWFPTQFIRDELVDTFENIVGSKWFPSALGKTAGEQGPAGQGIRGTFDRSDLSTTMQALWDHKTDLQRTMASKPDTYIRAKKGKGSIASEYWKRGGRVLIPTRLSVPNTRVTSVLSTPKTVGSAFVPYHPHAKKHAQDDVEKATVAYLNSTAGITAMLGITSNKKIVYPNWSVDDWYNISFPDWDKLSAWQVKTLADAYDELCGKELKELRSMLTCDARRLLDEAVAKALRIPWDIMEETRIALASEPAITGKTFTGDSLVGGLQ